MIFWIEAARIIHVIEGPHDNGGWHPSQFRVDPPRPIVSFYRNPFAS